MELLQISQSHLLSLQCIMVSSAAIDRLGSRKSTSYSARVFGITSKPVFLLIDARRPVDLILALNNLFHYIKDKVIFLDGRMIVFWVLV